MKTIQVSKGDGGSHGDSPYYKVTLKDKHSTEIRIIENINDFDPFTVAPHQKYYNRDGQAIQWNKSRKSWEIIN